MDDYIHEGLALIQEALKDYLPPKDPEPDDQQP